MRKRSPKRCGIYKSGFEADFAADLKRRGIQFSYETVKIRWTPPVATYTPDWEIRTNGRSFLVETKGYFTAIDRSKLKHVKEQNPDLDLRLVFMTPNRKIHPKSKTTYATWAEQHGFMWAAKVLPKEWLSE